MNIWIDGDACPSKIKEILFKAANRTETKTIIVANQFLSVPPSNWISKILVQKGFDVADNLIVDKLSAGDLVVTADIPLANDAIEKGAKVLTPRGKILNLSNIKQALALRDFNTMMRDAGANMSGPDKFSDQDIRRFANELDKILAKTNKTLGK